METDVETEVETEAEVEEGETEADEGRETETEAEEAAGRTETGIETLVVGGRESARDSSIEPRHPRKAMWRKKHTFVFGE